MMPAPIPGSHLFRWVRNVTLRVGVITGVFLTAVMLTSVLVATRLPFLEPFADLRNGISYAAFTLIALIPLMCFLRAPLKMFASAMCGWAMLSVSYVVMGFFFANLHTRLGKTPFHIFILGAAVYGVAAVALWVTGMVASLREHPMAATRRRL